MSERVPPEVGKSSDRSRDVLVFEKSAGTASSTFVGKVCSRVFYRLQVAGSPIVIRYGSRYRRVHPPTDFPAIIAKYTKAGDKVVKRGGIELDVSKPCSAHFVILEEPPFGYY